MTAGTIALIAILVFCPLMMLLMMRMSGHGHGRQEHQGHQGLEEPSLEELKRRRDELDSKIAAREWDEVLEEKDRPTHTGH